MHLERFPTGADSSMVLFRFPIVVRCRLFNWTFAILVVATNVPNCVFAIENNGSDYCATNPETARAHIWLAIP